MQIMIPNKKTGGLRTKQAFFTEEERRIISEDRLQNCAPPRTEWEQGEEPIEYGDRLEAAREIRQI